MQWGGLFVCIFLASIFRLIWLWEILQCDAGGWECIQQIALGSSETKTWIEIITRFFHDRFYTELGFSSILLGMGIFFARKHPFRYWVVGCVGGLFLLGLGIDTLRSYHIRIFWLPVLIISVLGWSQISRFGYALVCIWVGLQWFSSVDITGKEGGVYIHDTLAKNITEIQGKIWLEGLNDTGLYAPGVVLSCVLSGMDTTRFSNTPMGSTLVILSSHSDIVIFENYSKSTSSVDLSTLNGGYDWATVLFPEEKVILFEQ